MPLSKEKFKEYWEKWYVKHGEQHRERARKYYQEHKEQYKKRDKGEDKLKQKMRCYAKYHIKNKKEECSICKSIENLDVHHIKYDENPKNWIILCRSCHLILHEMVKI